MSEEEKTKISYLLHAMAMLHYSAINLTDKDLQYGKEFLLEMQKNNDLPFTSANVYLKDSGKLFAKPYIIQKIAGVKVGIFGVTNSFFNDRMQEYGFEIKDPVLAAKSSVAELRKKCDVVVALAYIGLEKSKELAEQVEGIDFIVSGYKWDLTNTPVQVGKTVIMKPGSQGKYLGQITFNAADKKAVLVQGKLVNLNDKITDDPELSELIKKYDTETGHKADTED